MIAPKESPRRRRPYAARASTEDRRVQLLDAALAVIVRDGYAKVSIDAIAREAGVTRPVVYGVFDGLGDLLTTLLDRQQARALEQLAPLLVASSGPDAEEPLRVTDMVRTVAEAVKNDPETWRPILLAPQGTPEAVRLRIEGDRQRVREHIASILELSLEPTGVPADVDVLAHAVMAVLEHFGQLLLQEPELFTVERLVATVKMVLSAVGSGGRFGT